MNSGGEEGKQWQGIEIERRKAKQSKKKKRKKKERYRNLKENMSGRNKGLDPFFKVCNRYSRSLL